MNFFGIGGLELILVMLVGLFVVGPVRLVEGARTARKYMTELRRQREELTQIVEDAVDVEGVRTRLEEEGVLDAVRDLSSELNSFREETRSVERDVDELKRAVTSIDRPQGYRRRVSESSADSGDDKQEEATSDDDREDESTTRR